MQIQPYKKEMMFFTQLLPLVRSSGLSSMGSIHVPSRMCLIQKRIPPPDRLISKWFWRQCTCLWRLSNKRAVTHLTADTTVNVFMQLSTNPQGKTHLTASFRWGDNNPIPAPKFQHFSLYLLLSAYFHFSWCVFSSSIRTFLFSFLAPNLQVF